MEKEIVSVEKNIDINKALNEFQEKAKIDEAQKILKVDKALQIPIMDRWVIKLSGGVLKEERQAEWVLFWFVLVGIVVSIYLLVGATKTVERPPVPQIDGTFAQATQ